MKTLLVLGATGLVGGQVLQRALRDERVSSVVAPTRRALPTHSRLNNPIVDFERLPEQADWWHCHAVICAMGSTRRKAGSAEAFQRADIDYPAHAATLARAAGATSLALTSSLGANSDSGNLYLRTKGMLEDRLADLGFRSLTILRPSIIAGKRPESRPLESVGLRALEWLEPLVPARYRSVAATDIADCLLARALADRTGLTIIESDEIARQA